jgi:hypothetical protein
MKRLSDEEYGEFAGNVSFSQKPNSSFFFMNESI